MSGHALVESIDVSEAAEIGGVLAPVTWEDIKASDAPGYMRTDDPAGGSAESNSETGATVPDHPLLADRKVTYQGQPVAAVVAEDRYTAHNALDVIDVDYDRLDAVIDPETAMTDGSPTIHEQAPRNVAFEWDRYAADGRTSVEGDQSSGLNEHERELQSWCSHELEE